MDVPQTVTAALEDRPVDGATCLEAGAGVGNTTTGLLANGGRRVYAITNDSDHATAVRERIGRAEADRTAVIEVDGRQGDILRFETADSETIPVFPLAISSVVEGVPGVRRAQIVRTEPNTLRVRLDVTATAEESKVWERVERDVLEFLQQREIIDVSVERADRAPQRDPTSGKFRHV